MTVIIKEHYMYLFHLINDDAVLIKGCESHDRSY